MDLIEYCYSDDDDLKMENSPQNNEINIIVE